MQYRVELFFIIAIIWIIWRGKNLKKKIKNTEPTHWTQKEIRQLERLYPTNHNKDLAKILGRTIASLLGKAKILGLKKDWEGGYRVPPPPQNENLWTQEEIVELRTMYLNSGSKEIAAKLNRTPQAIKSKIRKLGLFSELNEKDLRRKFTGINQWSADDIEILKNLYTVKSLAQIAAELGRTPNSISKMASKLKLSHSNIPASKRLVWTDETDAFLAEHIAKWPLEKIAEKLNLTPSAVQRRAWRKHFSRNCPNPHHQKSRPWTRQEIAQLQYWLPMFSNEEIAAKLERGVEAIIAKRKRMGLKRPPFWTDKNIAILKKYFPIESNTNVAQRLGIDNAKVRAKASELGLRKSVYAKK